MSIDKKIKEMLSYDVRGNKDEKAQNGDRLQDIARFFYQLGLEQGKASPWKSAAEPPSHTGYVITCIDDQGVPQSVGFARYLNGKWHSDDHDNADAVIDYWMEIPPFKKDD